MPPLTQGLPRPRRRQSVYTREDARTRGPSGVKSRLHQGEVEDSEHEESVAGIMYNWKCSGAMYRSPAESYDEWEIKKSSEMDSDAMGHKLTSGLRSLKPSLELHASATKTVFVLNRPSPSSFLVN